MRTRDSKKEAAVKKQAILLIVHDGLKGFSMQKLADKCKISVATLYIYYKNKEDLILQLGKEVAYNYSKSTLRNFSSDMGFAEGIRLQWHNRLEFAMKENISLKFFDILRHSPYADEILKVTFYEFGTAMNPFLEKAKREKQLKVIPLEAFWCIAFGPLYHLIQFNQEKKGFGNTHFEVSQEVVESCIQSVLKALKPD